jgi:hypothetical protein
MEKKQGREGLVGQPKVEPYNVPVVECPHFKNRGNTIIIENILAMELWIRLVWAWVL